MKKKEQEVFAQQLNNEELEKVTGGDFDISFADCTEAYRRDIYKGGFPNCAATVEEGSYCGTNDACVATAVKYEKIKSQSDCFISDCHKAWK